MAQRKDDMLGQVASMPWPAGLVLGVIAFLTVRFGIDWLLSGSSNPYLARLGQQLSQGSLSWFAWVLLGICWVGALLSYIRQRHRKQLLDTQTSLNSLRAISWREFEMLVGEAFRRRGYTIEETGLGGPDGGVDLVLRKQGTTTLVQCKQWRKQRVDVNNVREMFGLLTHHGAQAAIIVCIGDFTSAARRFAEGKPIRLIHGEALLRMVDAVKTSPDQARRDATEPRCPRCSAPMVRRVNRRTGEAFWGCSEFPRCRAVRSTNS